MRCCATGWQHSDCACGDAAGEFRKYGTVFRVQRSHGRPPQSDDYAYCMTAQEIAHQWWAIKAEASSFARKGHACAPMRKRSPRMHQGATSMQGHPPVGSMPSAWRPACLTPAPGQSPCRRKIFARPLSPPHCKTSIALAIVAVRLYTHAQYLVRPDNAARFAVRPDGTACLCRNIIYCCVRCHWHCW